MYTTNIADIAVKKLQRGDLFMSAKKEKVPVTFFDYKKFAVRAAKESFYPQETVEKIRQAKNDDEITSILTNARKQSLKIAINSVYGLTAAKFDNPHKRKESK